MHYTDVDKRILELRRTADVFKEKGFAETSSRLSALSLLLKDGISHKAMIQEYMDLLNLFGNEFKESLNFGNDYRWYCLKEIGDLIHDFVEAVEIAKVRESWSATFPIMQNLASGKRTIDEISQTFYDKSIDRRTRFHLTCYSYLIIVEGTFDEVARIIFFLTALKNGDDVNIQEVQRLEVRDIYAKLNPKPTLLRNWEEKKHIRNAIGHATAYFDETNNTVRFVDNFVKSKPFDKTYRWEEFIEILSELQSSVSAFILFMVLYRVRDVLFAVDLP